MTNLNIDYEKIIQLVICEKNIDNELSKSNLTEEEKLFVKLKIVKELYKKELYSQGAKILNQVIKTPNKTKKY